MARFAKPGLLFVCVCAVVYFLAVQGCHSGAIVQNPVEETPQDTDVSDGENETPQATEADNDASVNGESQGDPKPAVAENPKAKQQAGLVVVSFDDLNIGMQKDTRFRPIMLEYENGRAKNLFGKRINIGGYMNPDDSLEGVSEFILLKNLSCKFGPGGQADHLIHVVMEDGLTTDFTDAIIYVEGELQLNPFPEDGPTWSIYDLKATKVSRRPPSRTQR